MIQDIEPKHLYNQYDPSKKPSDDSCILVFKGRSVLLKTNSKDIDSFNYRNCQGQFPSYAKETKIQEAGNKNCHTKDQAAVNESTGDCLILKGKDFAGDEDFEKAIYLLSVDKEEYFLILKGDDFEMEGCEYVRVTQIRSQKMLGLAETFAINTARQIYAWYVDNHFCGTCGSITQHSKTERAMCCPNCGRTIYPRIQPAVIVGVTHGDEILLTRYSDRPLAYDALVAGFTEIGETFEQTVEREVMEEVGLKVKNIRYYKSQPWAISDDILAGYYCDVDGDTTVRLDKSELKRATWTKREDVIGQPDNFSLTGEMMMTFKAGKEPK